MFSNNIPIPPSLPTIASRPAIASSASSASSAKPISVPVPAANDIPIQSISNDSTPNILPILSEMKNLSEMIKSLETQRTQILNTRPQLDKPGMPTTSDYKALLSKNDEALAKANTLFDNMEKLNNEREKVDKAKRALNEFDKTKDVDLLDKTQQHINKAKRLG